MTRTHRTETIAMPGQPRPAPSLNRRALMLSTAVALFLAVPTVAASQISAKFTFEALEKAQKEGKPILIDIFAAWCPVCRVQRPIIEDLVLSDRFKDFVYFEVDFDRQKDVLRRLNAQKQSTLIVFKGATEVGRTVGDTDRASIETLLAKALG